MTFGVFSLIWGSFSSNGPNAAIFRTLPVKLLKKMVVRLWVGMFWHVLWCCEVWDSQG